MKRMQARIEDPMQAARVRLAIRLGVRTQDISDRAARIEVEAHDQHWVYQPKPGETVVGHIE